MYDNSSGEFDFGHCLINVKITAGFKYLFPFTIMVPAHFYDVNHDKMHRRQKGAVIRVTSHPPPPRQPISVMWFKCPQNSPNCIKSYVKIQNFLEGMLPDPSIMALLLKPLCFLIIFVPKTFVVPTNVPTQVTPPLLKASDAHEMKPDLDKKCCGITHESLLNQFISGNSYLNRRTYPDNSVELVKPRVALDMIKTIISV